MNLVLNQYRKFDQIIKRFRKATGLSCPLGCSYCCHKWPVEATVLEVLPLAREIYRRGMEQEIMGLIEQRRAENNDTCVFLLPQEHARANGACSFYNWRPLMCRLFGFATRRNKRGDPELCSCKIIKKTDPASIKRAHMALRQGLTLPIYQDAFFTVASLDPARGYRRFPINLAIKEALEYLYWASPGGETYSNARAKRSLGTGGQWPS
ncbi:MAG TPA: YkgJ family cysteine cluster protein [Desulfobacteraceae bacterium]|nr:YkgJ family cysteine cluster protein [Desulfobacteraceae bacterium]